VSAEDRKEKGESIVNAARSALVFALFSGIENIPSIFSNSFQDTVARKPKDRIPYFLSILQSLTVEDVKNATTRYIQPLFDGTVPKVFTLSCPEGNVKQVRQDLAKAQPVRFIFNEISVEKMELLYSNETGYSQIRKQIVKEVEKLSKREYEAMMQQGMMSSSSSNNENLNGLSMSGLVDGQPVPSDHSGGLPVQGDGDAAGAKIAQPNGFTPSSDEKDVENGTPPKKLKPDPGFTASGIKHKQ